MNLMQLVLPQGKVQMIDISINDSPQTVPSGTTVVDLFTNFPDILGSDPSRGGIAMAINGAVVPQTEWPNVAVKPGDQIVIVTAAQGG